jgi:hypothetical protein
VRPARPGTIFVDRDGDGRLSASDEIFTDGVVFWETTADAPIDERGFYSLAAPDGEGIVWVLGRHGLDPGPFWADVPAGGDRTVDIPVRRLSVLGDLTFVVATDTHAGIAEMPFSDQAFVLQQATRLEPRPHFIAVTGDITQSTCRTSSPRWRMRSRPSKRPTFRCPATTTGTTAGPPTASTSVRPATRSTREPSTSSC